MFFSKTQKKAIFSAICLENSTKSSHFFGGGGNHGILIHDEVGGPKGDSSKPLDLQQRLTAFFRTETARFFLGWVGFPTSFSLKLTGQFAGENRPCLPTPQKETKTIESLPTCQPFFFLGEMAVRLREGIISIPQYKRLFKSRIFFLGEPCHLRLRKGPGLHFERPPCHPAWGPRGRRSNCG